MNAAQSRDKIPEAGDPRAAQRAPGVWLVRGASEALGERLAQGLDATVYRAWEARAQGADARTHFASIYRQHPQWIMVAATGIAVRMLDGLTADKRTDPAVVVLDEGAHFAIALLGGHEAGANRLAYQVANLLGAVPVVTTATEALKPLVLGIGCRKGVSAGRIAAAVSAVLDATQLTQVREVATVDLKARETGLLDWCATQGLPLRVLTRAALVQRAWVTTPSPWVRETLGLDGVCEPCALLASPGGTLWIPKTTLDGVAVAVVKDATQ